MCGASLSQVEGSGVTSVRSPSGVWPGLSVFGAARFTVVHVDFMQNVLTLQGYSPASLRLLPKVAHA